MYSLCAADQHHSPVCIEKNGLEDAVQLAVCHLNLMLNGGCLISHYIYCIYLVYRRGTGCRHRCSRGSPPSNIIHCEPINCESKLHLESPLAECDVDCLLKNQEAEVHRKRSRSPGQGYDTCGYIAYVVLRHMRIYPPRPSGCSMQP